MNFYTGSITEAVSLSKTKDAIFVVFVKGNNEGSIKLNNMLNTEKIRMVLESDNFVVIKIRSDEQTYIQFASIYQMVPVPSIFFIGKNGTPLEVVTDIVNSTDELENKIEGVLIMHGKKPNSSSKSFIEAEKHAVIKANENKDVISEKRDETLPVQDSSKIDLTASSEKREEPLVAEDPQKIVEQSTKNNEQQDLPQTSKVVCDGSTCKIIKEDNAISISAPESSISVEEKNNEEAKEKMRKLLEQRRRERVLEEQKLEKERELKRRQDAKAAQNVREWQKDNELKELKQSIKNEKLAEQEARERIRAQIQADRAERAQKNAVGVSYSNVSQASTSKKSETKPTTNVENTRLQFRLPSGEHHMNVFKIEQTLGEVRGYVKNDLLANSGVRDFYLATSYPRKEFTADDDLKSLEQLGLIPNGVILVIAKESKINPAGIITRSGGVINLFTGLFQFLLAPIWSVFGFVRNIFLKRSADDDRDAPPARRRFSDKPDSTGASTSKNDSGSPSKNANESKAYRRLGGPNIHRLRDNRKDSDDENATWNGNSTQQQ